MTQTLKINCPSCGGTSSQMAGVIDFKCDYCGTRYSVNQASHSLHLIPVLESMQVIQTSVDRTATELAIRRLRDDIFQIESQLYQFAGEYDFLKPIVEAKGFKAILRKFRWLSVIAFFATVIILGSIKNPSDELIAFLGFLSLIIMFFIIIGFQRNKGFAMKKRRYKEIKPFVESQRELIYAKQTQIAHLLSTLHTQ